MQCCSKFDVSVVTEWKINIQYSSKGISYLILSSSILDNSSQNIASKSGDHIEYIFSFFSHIVSNLSADLSFATKCTCESLDIECLTDSSILPEDSHHSTCATRVFVKDQEITQANASILSP
jgi:hypothetical protein